MKIKKGGCQIKSLVVYSNQVIGNVTDNDTDNVTKTQRRNFQKFKRRKFMKKKTVSIMLATAMIASMFAGSGTCTGSREYNYGRSSGRARSRRGNRRGSSCSRRSRGSGILP